MCIMNYLQCSVKKSVVFKKKAENSNAITLEIN